MLHHFSSLYTYFPGDLQCFYVIIYHYFAFWTQLEPFFKKKDLRKLRCPILPRTISAVPGTFLHISEKENTWIEGHFCIFWILFVSYLWMIILCIYSAFDYICSIFSAKNSKNSDLEIFLWPKYVDRGTFLHILNSFCLISLNDHFMYI